MASHIPLLKVGFSFASGVFESGDMPHNTQNKVLALEAFLMDVAAAAPDMMVACGADFTILNGNEAARTALGRRESAFFGRAIDDFFPGLSADLKKLPDGPFHIRNRRACRHNGGSFPTEIRGYARAGKSGPRYVLFICNPAERAHSEDARSRVRQILADSDLVLERVQRRC